MSKEVFGDEGNVGSMRESQMFVDLCAIQQGLYRWYRDSKDDLPNDEARYAFDRMDEALQDLLGQLED